MERQAILSDLSIQLPESVWLIHEGPKLDNSRLFFNEQLPDFGLDL